MAEKQPAGNFRQLMREQVGRFDVKLQNVYGMVARLKAPFGVRHFFSAVGRHDNLTLTVEQDDRLWVSDPKAIQYILQTSRYSFVKPYAARFALNSATGRGVNGAEGIHIPRLSLDEPRNNSASIGPDHYRQRRILLPAFGPSETRAQIPVFRQCAREVNWASPTEPRQRPYRFEAGPGIPKKRGVTRRRFPRGKYPRIFRPRGTQRVGSGRFQL